MLKDMSSVQLPTNIIRSYCHCSYRDNQFKVMLRAEKCICIFAVLLAPLTPPHGLWTLLYMDDLDLDIKCRFGISLKFSQAQSYIFNIIFWFIFLTKN